MGDLIHLPNRESGSKPTKAELDARASQTEGRRAEHIHRLRNELASQPKRKLSSADQITVAHALHKLLKRVEKEHQVRTAKVLAAAGIGTELDSTKHLSQYAIPEGGNPGRLRSNKFGICCGVPGYRAARGLTRGACLSAGHWVFAGYSQRSRTTQAGQLGLRAVQT